jgi:ferric-dicitrate binding protein FerR (iron transport regulator)
MADFKVTHDRSRPFVVHVRNAEIRDIGTQFEIRAYAHDAAVRVSVSSGAVSLAAPGHGSMVELAAGDASSIDSSGTLSKIAHPDVAADRAWVDGRLAFDDAALSAVAVDLGLWFDVDIRIANGPLTTRRISAIYNTPTLTGVLDALTATLDARYERHGRTITLLPRHP